MEQIKNKTEVTMRQDGKIDMADAIYVINVGGYIGSSTRSEIEYARKNGKEVLSLEPLSF